MKGKKSAPVSITTNTYNINNKSKESNKSSKKREVENKSNKRDLSNKSGENLKAQSCTNKKQKMLNALEASLGVVTMASKTSGVPRRDHYHWLKTDEKYREAVESLEDICLDLAENKLHKLIEMMEPSAIYFFLKCKGKKRGYVEKADINMNHSGELKTNGVLEIRVIDPEKEDKAGGNE